MKRKAEKITVVGDALIIFPIIVASVTERLGTNFIRTLHLQTKV